MDAPGAADAAPVELFQFFPGVAAQTFLRVVDAPYVVENLRFPLRRDGALAHLSLLDGQRLARGPEVLAHLCAKHRGLDGFLDAKGQLEAKAMRLLVTQELAALLRHVQLQSGDLEERLGPQLAEHCGVLDWAQRRHVEELLRREMRREAAALGIHGLSLKAAMGRMREVYEYFERGFLEHGSDSEDGDGAIDVNGSSFGGFLFHYASITTVDICLFAHLVEALAVPAIREWLAPATFPHLYAHMERMSTDYYGPTTARTSAAWRSAADEVNARNAFWPILPGVEYARHSSFYLDNYVFMKERRPSRQATGFADAAAPGDNRGRGADEFGNDDWYNFTIIVASIFIGTLMVQQYRKLDNV